MLPGFISLPAALDAPGRPAALAQICARHGVARLDLFGSATTAAFDPERSDVDLLVQFLPDAPHRDFVAYFDLKAALELLFGRRVDLVEAEAERLSNPYFRAAVLRQRQLLYALHAA